MPLEVRPPRRVRHLKLVRPLTRPPRSASRAVERLRSSSTELELARSSSSGLVQGRVGSSLRLSHLDCSRTRLAPERSLVPREREGLSFLYTPPGPCAFERSQPDPSLTALPRAWVEATRQPTLHRPCAAPFGGVQDPSLFLGAGEETLSSQEERHSGFPAVFKASWAFRPVSRLPAPPSSSDEVAGSPPLWSAPTLGCWFPLRGRQTARSVDERKTLVQSAARITVTQFRLFFDCSRHSRFPPSPSTPAVFRSLSGGVRAVRTLGWGGRAGHAIVKSSGSGMRSSTEVVVVAVVSRGRVFGRGQEGVELSSLR